MHNFEEEYQKSFQHARSTEGVNVEELWSKIEQALPPKKRRWPKFLFLFGIFFTISGGLGLYFLQQTPVNIEQEATLHSRVQNKLDFNQLQNDLIAASDSCLNKEAMVLFPINGNLASHTNDQYTKEENELLTVEQQLSTLLKQERAMHSITPNFIEDNRLANNLITIPETTVSRQATSKVQLSPAKSAVVTPSIVSKPLALLPISLPQIDAFVPHLNEAPTVTPSLEFGIASGVSRWHEKALTTSDENKQLDDALSSDAGLAVSLTVQWPLGKSINLTSGLTYIHTRTTFEFSETWDTMVYRNDLPGSDLIDAIALREVRHSNRLHSLNIPILVGIATSKQPLRLGVNAGIGLNFILSQAGKSLNANQRIFNYNEGTQQQPYSTFHLSYHIQPFVSYRVSKHFALQFRPEFSLHSLGDSPAYDHRRYALRSNWSLGVTWRRK